MWIEFFEELAAKGEAGVIWRSFLFEIWPAFIIVVAHQDWQWPGLATHTLARSLLYAHIVRVCQYTEYKQIRTAK